MITCKECKFWESTLGNCSCPKFEYNAENPTSDMLTYCDYDQYGAGFSTGPDFGCIHGTPK